MGMGIRDNVRRRRRERIGELLGQSGPMEERRLREGRIPADPIASTDPVAGLPRGLAPGAAPAAGAETEAEPDPEKWWKERQRSGELSTPRWAGLGGLPAPGPVPPAPPAAGSRGFLPTFAKGLLAQGCAAALLFGAAWVWFHSDLPGNGKARDWAASAVTRDMDFEAVQAWYENSFGGSPSFLPMFRGSGPSTAVSGGWSREEASLPADGGRVIRTFAQDGAGVRIAAAGGSAIKAVYAGRVLQVAEDGDGKATVLLQHAGKIVTVYGNVDAPEVRTNDWVEAGQRIGRIPEPSAEGGESLLYFAVKQDGKTRDPAEVVPFD